MSLESHHSPFNFQIYQKNEDVCVFVCLSDVCVCVFVCLLDVCVCVFVCLLDFCVFCLFVCLRCFVLITSVTISNVKKNLILVVPSFCANSLFRCACLNGHLFFISNAIHSHHYFTLHPFSPTTEVLRFLVT